MYGIAVKITPIEGQKEIYLTGEEPFFSVEITNESVERKRGIIIITWELVNVITIRPILFDLKPGEKKRYPLPREWLCSPGTAIYKIVTSKSPEDLLKDFEKFAEENPEIPGVAHFKKLEEGKVDFVPPEIPLQPFHVLAQFRVEDRALWLHQENIRKREEDLSLILTETAKRQELLLEEVSNLLQSLNEQAKQQTNLTNVIKKTNNSFSIFNNSVGSRSNCC